MAGGSSHSEARHENYSPAMNITGNLFLITVEAQKSKIKVRAR